MWRTAAVIVGLTTCAAFPAAEPGAATNPAVRLFLARGHEPLLTYRGSRRLEAHCDRYNASGWMDVATEMTTDGFHYRVMSEGGSEMIRTRVFRSMLEKEEEVLATGDAELSSFTPSNYDLLTATTAEAGLLRLDVRPKRREVALIEGAVYITDSDADLVRIEGRLAKNPSFWTKRVDLVKRYERVAGQRVPVRIDSTAQMRLAGTATLTVTYEYEMINGVHVASPGADAEPGAPAERFGVEVQPRRDRPARN